MSEVVKVGNKAVNLAEISSAHWEDGDRLFLHFSGGRFLQLAGRAADLVWQAFTAQAVDLETGEVGGDRGR